MSGKTREITTTALFSALTLIILYIASVWPTGRPGLVAVASVFAAAAVCDFGPAFGFGVFIIISLLGLLLIPVRSAPLLYMAFFGYYPVVKNLIERIGGVILQWILKLLVFNAALTVIWFLLRALIFDAEFPYAVAVLYLGGSVVFVLYDYGYTKIIRFYTERVSKYISRKG